MNDQPQSRELVIAKQVAGHLQKMQPEYRAVLPAHITPEEFTRIAQTAIQVNEELQECSQRSLIAACTRLAEMGLVPDGKHAALVAFNVKVKKRDPETGFMVERWEKRATPMPMVEGLRDLVRQSGQVKNWKARVVRQGDFFKHIDGDTESLVHEPQHDIDQPITHVYSIAYLENGELARHVMPIAAVEKIRKRSKNADKGPWADHYAEMALKTCMKQQSKYLPKSKDDLVRARFMGALRALDEADGFEPDQLAPAPRLSIEQATGDRLRQAIDAQVFEDEDGFEDVRQASKAQVGNQPQPSVIQPAKYVHVGPEHAGEMKAPAPAAPKATRRRRTADERLAEANAPKQPKQPPAATGNGQNAPAAAPAPASATPQQSTKAAPSASATTAPAAAASSRNLQDEVDDITQSGRDLEYERQQAGFVDEYVGDDRFPGDMPPDEAAGEDQEELAYRDGWHVRSFGKPRVPPRSLQSSHEVKAWLDGWDAYDRAAQIDNAPKTPEASEAMLDQMVNQVFV